MVIIILEQTDDSTDGDLSCTPTGTNNLTLAAEYLSSTPFEPEIIVLLGHLVINLVAKVTTTNISAFKSYTKAICVQIPDGQFMMIQVLVAFNHQELF